MDAMKTDDTDSKGLTTGSARHEAVLARFKPAIIDRLKLQTRPEDMPHDVPIFGEGLGLDSVDALLMALVIETEFGVEITDDDIFEFQSLNDVARFILTRRGET